MWKCGVADEFDAAALCSLMHVQLIKYRRLIKNFSVQNWASMSHISYNIIN